MKNKKLLVTGGCGFVGSNLARFLVNLGYKITIIDDLSTGSFDNIKDFDCEFVNCRINKEIDFRFDDYIKQSDFVIHLAATVGVKNVLEDCYETIMNNIEATEVILDACRVFNKRCLIASTSEVYGKNTTELSETDDVILGSPYKNRWSYATSKLIDEFLALDLYQKYKLPTTILRFFNISGPGQVSHYGMVIPTFIEQALSNKPMTIFYDGKQTRCFTHINNVCEIIYKLLDNEKSYGKIINIGNTEEVSILDLAKYIYTITGSNSEISFHQEKNIYDNNFEDMQRRLPNIKVLENILEFEVNWLSYKDIVNDIIMSKTKIERN